MASKGASTVSEVTPLQKKAGASASSFSYQVVLIGAGFLADAYDLFVIDMVMSIMHRLHPEGMTSWDKSLVASSTLTGAIVGQLSFGILGDWFGRKWTFIVSCVLIILGAVLSGCCVWTNGGFTIFYQLAICRFILGIGVGGEYPLAASIAAEGAGEISRGRLIAGVFSMQGWGMLLSCLFVLGFLYAEMPLEYIWRAVLILGALPAAAVIYMRTQMEDSDIFKKAHGSAIAASGSYSFFDHMRMAGGIIRKYWHPLVGTTMTWLLLDVTFYGTGSFKHRISSAIMDHGATTSEEHVWEEARFSMICCCLAIPGYLLSVAFIDILGRYNIQFWGFIAMAVNFFAVAGLSASRKEQPGHLQWAMLMCFGFTFLFSNFGPNTTTFVLPVEIYPTLVRATCHGISAAAGKVGAVIGVVAFSPCEKAYGIEAVLAGCGVICITGALFTFVFTTENPASLDNLDEQEETKA
jgi:PHS family inorganic phosphate transporter-like MFS transporter